jgi:hypothetical protein
MTNTPDWNHYATLHQTDGGDGVLEGFKSLRSGKLFELVSFVASVPEAARALYFIEVDGQRRLDADKILELSRRDDFPGRN